MRVLTGGRTPGARCSPWLALAIGLIALTIGLAWALARRRDGGPRARRLADAERACVGGDPRSDGRGPGLVGDPLAAIVLVLVIGLGAALATLALRSRDRRAAGPDRRS